MTTTRKRKPTRVSVSLPRELWEQVVAVAEGSDPRVSAAALAESLIRRGLRASPEMDKEEEPRPAR